MWIVYVAVFTAALFIFDYFLIDKRQYECVKNLSAPLKLPIIGHAWILFGVRPKDLYKFVVDIWIKCKNKNGVVYGFIGPVLEMGVYNNTYVEKILTSTKFISKSSLYNFLGDTLGHGLIFSTNQKWFNRRRVITPTFHFKILEQFFEVFQKQNKILLKQLKQHSNEKIFDIFPLIGMSVLKSLCETAMGCEITNEDYSYLNAVKELTYHVATSFLSPWHQIKFIYNFTPTKRAQDKCAKIIHDFTLKLIEERRELLQRSDRQNLDNLDDDVGLKKKMCLLDILLQSTIDGMPLSNQDIQEEVDTFTFAGHDTTASATCFTLYLISTHPDVQEKLLKEIDQVIGDGDVTFKSLNDFKYLENVIKESMRLYPPVPIISRRLHEEVDFGDFTAPANSNYNIPLMLMFRNPKYFENPDEFNPDRFLKNIPPFAFIPFSAGQRNCIGQKFAMVNTKVNIVNILRNYELLPGGIKPTMELQITLKSKIFLKLKERENKIE